MTPGPSGRADPPCLIAHDAPPSVPARVLDPLLRLFVKARLGWIAQRGRVTDADVAGSRRRLERLARLGGTGTTGVAVERTAFGGVAAEVVTPPAPGDRYILYLHGGGFVLGSPRTHRGLARALALACAARVVVPDHRLAPEHPHPAALDDALASWRALVAAGTPPARVVVAGDSAGGNLALALVHALRSAGEATPAGVVAFSPWTDLGCTAASIVANRDRDAMIPVAAMRVAVRLYAGSADVRQPALSPLHGDLRGFPPLLMHAGSHEVLYDDARRLVEDARAAGVAATLHVWRDMPHAFPVFVAVLPEARAAVDVTARFVRDVAP
jgi:epsilon-lactone hydrolase